MNGAFGDAAYQSSWLFALLHLLFASASVLHILLFKSNHRAALGWLAFVVVFPLAGPIFYWLFGVNRVRRKAQRESIFGWTEQGTLPEFNHRATTDALRNVGWHVVGREPVANNEVLPLSDGEAAYPAMLGAIASATEEVLLSTYIFDRDTTGGRFVKVLADAVGRGVRVCVLLDDIGRRHSLPTIVGLLKRHQVPVRTFMPLRLLPPSLSFNLRNHRKALLVDAQIAFVGGMNIGDRHLVKGLTASPTRDLHFQLRGPVLGDLRAVFAEDWASANGPSLPLLVRPLTLGAEASCACRVVSDGPDEQLDHLSLLIEGVISAARHRVTIVTPYFLPERRLIGALQSAALRGVVVSVVIPKENNWPLVRWALGNSLWELLIAGVCVLEQPAPFAHTKCLLVDDDYVLIGSTNLDPRSLRLNFELGVEVFDTRFAGEVSNLVAKMIARAEPLTRSSVAQRSVLVRLRDALAALLTPYI